MNQWKKKIIGSGLIITLILFAGGLCMGVMLAQAMAVSSPAGTENMPMAHQSLVGEHPEGISLPTPMSMLNVCVVDCVSSALETTSVKKFALDSGTSFPTGTVDQSLLLAMALTADGSVFADTPPPVPDVLFSVFKKE